MAARRPPPRPHRRPLPRLPHGFARYVLIGCGAAATIALYLALERGATRHVTVELRSPSTPAAASRGTTPAPPRKTPATPATARVVAPPDAEVTPPGATLAERIDLHDAAGNVIAVAVQATAHGSAPSCPLLLLYVREQQSWTPRFDATHDPAAAPLLADCGAAIALFQPLGAGAEFVGIATRLPDGRARALVLDATGTARTDTTTRGPGSILAGMDGVSFELDEQAIAVAAGTEPFGTLARIVRATATEITLRARVVPACDRGRLAPGSAARIAAANGTALVRVQCSTGGSAAALVDAKTVLDLLDAPATAIRDFDYVELQFDDASLDAEPDADEAPIPRLALLTDNAATGRGGAPPTRAATVSHPPAAPTHAAPAPPVSSTRSVPSGGSASGTGSGGSNRGTHPPADPVPTRSAPAAPVPTRPIFQPPAPPQGPPGAGPPP